MTQKKQVSGLDKFFGVTAAGSSMKVEIMAGLTTFFAMAYIIFVNPTILNQFYVITGETEMATAIASSVFVATCLSAFVGTLLMAVLSVPLNYFVVYPAYVVCYHLPLETIIGMYQAIRPSVDGLLECLLVFNMPFTFFKGLLDVALCFLIYKPLSPLLHK